MAKARWTVEQMKEAKRIERDGVFVKADTLVAKGKVEKIEPGMPKIIQAALTPVGPEVILSAFKESGIMYAEAPIRRTFTLPTGEIILIKHRFDLTPCPAPRMTSSDRWRNPRRASVQRYFDWRVAFAALCKTSGYTLQETLRVVFIMPLPKHLSVAKKQARLGQPHKQRPDTDNMLKSVKDSFDADDGFVWDERGIKIWGEKGEIIIF